MTTRDWQDRIAWRRRELERDLYYVIDQAARMALAGRPPGARDVQRVRQLKSELAVLTLVERAAVRIDAEDLW